MKSAIIIGAGIGGLATANLLAKAGYQVTVYEKNAQPGGRAGTMKLDGFTFDTGPSWYLMPEVFQHYFELFGKSVRQELDLVRLTPAYKVFFEDAEPITITSDSEQDSATFEAIEPGAGKKLINYVANGNSIYQLSLKHFLYTNFTSYRDLVRWDILRHSIRMARLAFTPIHSYVRRYVRDARLQQILEYPMVFLGSSPFSAPAIYSLMSALDFREGVYYPRGGVYTIIERLVALGTELGVTYHYSTPVKRITTDGMHATGVILENGSQLTADVVISNADLHFTETQLLSANEQTYPPSYWQAQEPGPSALLMYLGVKDSVPELEHHNLFFVADWEQNFRSIFDEKTIPASASLYICKPSATDSTVAPKGSENLFVLVPLPAGIEVDDSEANNIADSYLDIIEKQLQIPDFKKRITVKKVFSPSDFGSTYNAWQNSALGPSHILRQSALFRTQNQSKKIKNLYYVGGFTVPGIGLPMCLIGAELVYKRLAGDQHSGPIRSIQPIAGDKV